jgi:hypothetical protein
MPVVETSLHACPQVNPHNRSHHGHPAATRGGKLACVEWGHAPKGKRLADESHAAGPDHAYQHSGEPAAFAADAEVSAGIHHEQVVQGEETRTPQAEHWVHSMLASPEQNLTEATLAAEHRPIHIFMRTAATAARR